MMSISTEKLQSLDEAVLGCPYCEKAKKKCDDFNLDFIKCRPHAVLESLLTNVAKCGGCPAFTEMAKTGRCPAFDGNCPDGWTTWETPGGWFVDDDVFIKTSGEMLKILADGYIYSAPNGNTAVMNLEYQIELYDYLGPVPRHQ